MTEQRCHYCFRTRDCRSSPLGRPTCAVCWPTLRCTDHLGYLRCADCQGTTGARIEHEGVIGDYARADEARCDRCGALGGAGQ